MNETSYSSAGPSGSGRPGEPNGAFLELARLDLSELTLTQALSRVAGVAKTTLPGAHEVSVTLMEGERARTVAFTGDLAVHLDERQYDKGFGPCLDAAVSGDTIVLPDTSDDPRYPDFGAVAVRAGVRSSLSVGMPVPQRVVGGLNVYAYEPNAFDKAAVELAQQFAGFGAVVLVNAALVDSKAALAGQLERAMTSRAVIEQAKGIIMGRKNCDADQAFAELVRWSQRANRKLHVIASDIVAQVSAGS
ncbi:MAG TPA: GAF and ANTAR domain-containing protein [Mycobacteriales bacterium]